MRIVFKRSLWFSNALVAMTAGTVQPNPNSIGRNARPESPTIPIVSFMTYATLAIYPLSSRNASARKRIKIFGRNVRIPPTPASAPSTTREITQSEAPAACTLKVHSTIKVPVPVQSNLSRKSPTVNVRKNTSAMIPKNTGIPRTGCVKRRSTRSVICDFSSLLKRHSLTTDST